MFWVQLAIAIVLAVVSYLLTPKPKQSKPAAAQDFEGPTSDAGRPVPVVFGTLTMKSPNVLHWTDKSIRNYEVDA